MYRLRGKNLRTISQIRSEEMLGRAVEVIVKVECRLPWEFVGSDVQVGRFCKYHRRQSRNLASVGSLSWQTTVSGISWPYRYRSYRVYHSPSMAFSRDVARAACVAWSTHLNLKLHPGTSAWSWLRLDGLTETSPLAPKSRTNLVGRLSVYRGTPSNALIASLFKPVMVLS